MDDLHAWAYLSRVIEGPSRALQACLGAGYSAPEIAQMVKARDPVLGPLLKETESRYQWDRSDDDLAAAEAVSARLVTPDSPEWPQWGCAGKAIPPHALWVTGAPLTQQLVGVVGVREATGYGRRAAATLVRGLAEHGWGVVSGGAIGIDAVALAAAVGKHVPSVIVSASGIDRVYPARNRELFSRVDTVITEYPPGASPQRHRFLMRNRLVAALGRGLVVVEAAWRSGSLNTLHWAHEMGRPVMAVPGSFDSRQSLGCHDKIRQGQAVLVTSPAEILEQLLPVGMVDPDGQYALEFGQSLCQQLSREELQVFDATTATPATTEHLATESGIAVGQCQVILERLRAKGYVHKLTHSWVRKDLPKLGSQPKVG